MTDTLNMRKAAGGHKGKGPSKGRKNASKNNNKPPAPKKKKYIEKKGKYVAGCSRASQQVSQQRGSHSASRNRGVFH